MAFSRRFAAVAIAAVFSLISLSSAEIWHFNIRADSRPIIALDAFGFTHSGRLELNATNIALSNPNLDLDLSKVGFFLSTCDGWFHVLQQLEDGEISCALQSNVIKPVLDCNLWTGLGL